MSKVPPPPDSNGNPLIALAVAVIYAILYVLQGIRYAVGLVTIRVPSLIVRMLQYSLTISLGFPHFLGLFGVVMLVLFFLIRYRYLTRYTQLKEPALPPPSPTLADRLLPMDAAALGLTDSRASASSFHNYLDDFLSAIRIFGYLEKPVFHELSRHLQTRRLAAGDTMEIGGGEFWCVVEGKVQVFAPDASYQASRASSPGPSGKPYNGYHLLNEVSTGGTLSSLFSILHLFTEDVKLSWNSTPADQQQSPQDSENLVPSVPMQRQNSDVSQFDMSATTSPTEVPSELQPNKPSRGRSSSMGTASDTVRGSEDGESDSFTTPSSPQRARSQSESIQSSPAPQPSTTPVFKTDFIKDETPERKRSANVELGGDALAGTIARATEDTTLAVIPAAAFRKLTTKFPKASGTVVQVVLERFSRVTFMTAHKYLGLTKEILRSESSLNALVSHPLPRSFYTGGGMQALRDRFQPEAHAHKSFNSAGSSPDPRTGKDYFNYVPVSPTVKAPSLYNGTPKATSPAHRKSSWGKDSVKGLTKVNEKEGEASPITEKSKDRSVPGGQSTNLAFSPNTRHPSPFVRRTSAMRKQVGAGDLALSSLADENQAYYRPSAQTPGFARMDTFRGRNSTQSSYDRPRGAQSVETPAPSEEEQSVEGEIFNLKEAVLESIVRSIGLTQPSESGPEGTYTPFGGKSSLAPSVSALSTPNSPMFPPNSNFSTLSGRHRPAAPAPPFGNVLDLINASKENDGVIGGMLREAAMHTRGVGDDEASSISASIHDSQFGYMGGLGALGGLGDKKVLKELENHVEILFFKKGSVLVKEGERSPGMYYVIDGFLETSIPSHQSTTSIPKSGNLSERPFGAALGLESKDDGLSGGKEDEALFTVKPGGIAGYLSSLCCTDSYVNIAAKTDCFVGFLPHHTLQRIMERRPIVLLTLAKRLLSLLSPLVLHIDAALDWQQLNAGQVLYEKGDKAADFYIVINGRLRAYTEKDSHINILREYGQNDSIGELDVITASPRTETIHAIRDSELVRIPAALFDAISVKHPETTIQFMKLIAGRVRRAVGEEARTGIAGGKSSAQGGLAGSVAGDVNLKTVCVIGSTRNVPVAQFASKLKNALEEVGASTSYLDQATVMRHLGRHAFARIGKLKVAGWLADQEQHYRTVLYVADSPPTSQWTLTCIRQADLVLVVSMGDDPSLGEYEKLLLATKTTARKELIMLHDERTVAPGSTRRWLSNRPWIQRHYHVELPGVVTPVRPAPTVHDPAAIAAFKHLRERVETRIRKYRGLRPFARPRRPPHMNDFARIARRLCGQQIGIVLGGGGARGISHIGMLQALEEYGIPIDAIGGCSIGSFVGGLYARETDLLETAGRTKQFAGRMGSMWRILSDVTYPFVAYTTGHEFNRGIYKAFYNTHIEDFWIPFFANSTNITHSRMEVHRTGYAWRYVRASMTLAGLLPPLSDNGNLLVDGGYMDNTPIQPLRDQGIHHVIVVDVGSVDDTSPRNYGDSVSGWWIFLNRFNPFYERRVLSMTEVSARLTYVTSVKTLEEVKVDPTCLYLPMPCQQFDTLGGFKQFSEILAIGLKAGREGLKKWKEEGRLPTGFVDENKAKGRGGKVDKGNRLRRMSI
ncbi:lysophospholipase NTE1 [Cryptococcus wingfieldii CBS 7118]|uniref:Lysophospholipase NTE1 n=1 Tax=Cryptococcus wingfieldii CBS 7118 TaxID=1295528 RepID=A0A1E3JWG9_9TREE|nr:lysophospholipase NTE1 [Cryptococcus wingfieldii CBS 7118]ODO05143.1 lysophospholipase NTE1 [Cryptococcus wingfieldii CBS 7118]